jgi:arylsulfatase A-like enzyme
VRCCRPLALAAALAACLAISAAQAAGAGAEGGRPNILVVETDDQTLAMLNPVTMPHVARVMGDQGTAFTEYVTQALCCPSRASFLTGQYPHNDGVESNVPGYPSLVGKHNTLPVWLRNAGYRTGLVGKFLNGYAGANGARPAPGFHEWVDTLDNRYFRTPVSDNGVERTLRGTGGHGYLTNVLVREARGFIRDSSLARRPFFLWFTPLAPHSGHGPRPAECSRLSPIPAPGDAGTFAKEPLPAPPSYDEPDVSDKPSFESSLPPLDADTVARLTGWYRCALESLAAVDRGVRRLAHELRVTHELSDTMIVFTSDNGFFYGEHRQPLLKELPYEEVVHLPLLIRPPASIRGLSGAPASIGLPVGGADLAPTFVRLARARPCTAAGRCRTLDGRSLLPLLRGNDAGWPTDRGIPIELHDVRDRHASLPCEFQAIRTPTRMYAEYTQIHDPQTGDCVASAEAELYDLAADPFELDNLLSTDPQGSAAERAALAARLDALRACAGTDGPNACE